MDAVEAVTGALRIERPEVDQRSGLGEAVVSPRALQAYGGGVN